MTFDDEPRWPWPISIILLVASWAVVWWVVTR